MAGKQQHEPNMHVSRSGELWCFVAPIVGASVTMIMG